MSRHKMINKAFGYLAVAEEEAGNDPLTSACIGIGYALLALIEPGDPPTVSVTPTCCRHYPNCGCVSPADTPQGCSLAGSEPIVVPREELLKHVDRDGGE